MLSRFIISIVLLSLPSLGSNCYQFYDRGKTKHGTSTNNNLLEARYETDHFEIHSTVDNRTQELTEKLIDLYPQNYGENSFQTALFGGHSSPIKIISPPPPGVSEILLEHLQQLNEYFKNRFPGKKFEFTTAEIRISNDGTFDVSHLHLDFGGAEESFSTSTTFNKSGVGTYVARKENLVQLDNVDINPLIVPLEYRNHVSDWNLIPGHGSDVSALRRTDVGETLIVHRVKFGLVNSRKDLEGKNGPERQQKAVLSGAWHASPGLIPSEALKNPRRFWIGVTVVFY